MKISQLKSAAFLTLGLTALGCSEKPLDNSPRVSHEIVDGRKKTAEQVDAALPKPLRIVKKANECPSLQTSTTNGVEVREDGAFGQCGIKLRTDNDELRYYAATPQNINDVLDAATVAAIESGKIPLVRQKLLTLLEKDITLGRTQVRKRAKTDKFEFSRISEVHYPTQGWARLRHSQTLTCNDSSTKTEWTDEWSNTRPYTETQTRIVAPNFTLTAEPPNFLLPGYKSEVPRLENFDPIMAVPSDEKPDHQWMDEHFPSDRQLEAVCGYIVLKISDLTSNIPIDATERSLLDISPKARNVRGTKMRQTPPRILLEIKQPR